MIPSSYSYPPRSKRRDTALWGSIYMSSRCVVCALQNRQTLKYPTRSNGNVSVLPYYSCPVSLCSMYCSSARHRLPSLLGKRYVCMRYSGHSFTGGVILWQTSILLHLGPIAVGRRAGAESEDCEDRPNIRPLTTRALRVSCTDTYVR